MIKSSKSIMLICPVYQPYAGGGGQYFPILVEALIKSNKFEKILILTEYHSKKKLVEKNENSKIFRILPRRDTKPNKGVLYWFLSFFLTYFVFLAFIPIMIFKHKVKFIHFTRYISLTFFLLMFVLKKLFKLKVVLDMRTTVEREQIIKYLFGIDLVISNSVAVYRQMLDFNIPKKINKLVHNPLIMPKKFSKNEINKYLKFLNLDINKKYILFVGQFLERKSIIEVIDAFLEINKSNKSYELILVGRNMIGKKFNEKIKNVKNIVVLNPQPRNTIIALMQFVELIVQPSKVEGIPRVSLEALYLNKKILLPSCVPEFKKNNSFFIEKTFCPKKIANRILKILESSKRPHYDLSLHSVENYNDSINQIYSYNINKV